MRKLSPKTIEMMQKLVVDMAMIVCIGIVLAIAVNQMRPNSIVLFDKSVLVEEDLTAAVIMQELDGLHAITPNMAYAKMKVKDVLFVDARHPNEYNKGHVHGAINMPFEQFSNYINDFLEMYPPDTVIVVYCDGKNCEQSEFLGQELVYAGYATVYYMEPNWQSWLNDERPVTLPQR